MEPYSHRLPQYLQNRIARHTGFVKSVSNPGGKSRGSVNNGLVFQAEDGRGFKPRLAPPEFYQIQVRN